MLENEIQREIKAYLEVKGYLVFRMNAGQARYNVKLSPPGTPDLLCIMDNGQSLWLEVKQPGKGATEIQEDFHNKLKARGQWVMVAHSVEDVKRSLPTGRICRQTPKGEC